ncbi:MAG TPA: hypothetical protein VF587_02045, partial [Solirubrobacteraceae bacterium]
MTAIGLPAARVVALGLLAALVLPVTAQATTVRAQADECALRSPDCVAELNIKYAPGERNDMSVRPDGAGIVVTDAAAPLVADRNCVRREDGSVRCELTGRPFTQVLIETGDAADVVRVSLPAVDLVEARLGDGDDRFEGEAKEVSGIGLDGDDVLVVVGGVGRLDGRVGADVLLGGPDGDRELRGGPGRDRISGGPGDDVLVGADGDFDGFDDTEAPAADDLD